MSPPQPASLCRFIFISGHVLGSDCARRSSNWNLFTLILTFSPSRFPSRFALFFPFLFLSSLSDHFVTFAANQTRMPSINERMGEGTFSQSNHALLGCDTSPKRRTIKFLDHCQTDKTVDKFFFSFSKVSVNYLTYTVKLQEGMVVLLFRYMP